MKKIYILLIIMILLQLSVFGQQLKSITGLVLDNANAQPLPGASIVLKNNSKGTIADQEGKFILENLKQDKFTVIVSFIGYESKTINCDLTNKNTDNYKIELKQKVNAIENVEIIAQTEGQQQALLQQKNSTNIKNIISAEQIQSFPDMNAAEVLQRIPGITIQRDQGEGKFVQLRGTPPELTNFNINGEQISSPEGGVRYVGMDIIAADQIDFIEVTKVLTPDMDGDAIAGNVNVITKKAQDTLAKISASVSGGYNNLMQTDNEQIQFSYGQRIRKFGFQMNSSYYRNSQGSHNMEYDYTRGPILSEAQDGDTTENFYILYKDIELRHYTIERKRIGISATFDYNANERNSFYLRTMYNRYTDNEQRRRLIYGLSDANSLLEYREAGMERETKERMKIQEISSIILGASHKLHNKAKLEYEISYSLATDQTPNTMYASFDNGGITMVIDKSEARWPKVTFPYQSDSIDAFTYKNYEFDNLQMMHGLVTDRNLTSKMSFQLPYKLSDNQNGYIQFGVKFRSKDKNRDNESQSFNKYFKKVSLYSQTAPELILPTVSNDFSETNLLNRNYVIDHTISPANMRAFYEAHPQHFKFDEAETWEETYGEDYQASEDIYSGYIMFRHDIQNLMVLGGVRYELTEINNSAVKAGINYEAGGVLYMDSIQDKRTHKFFLPQIQLKYSVNERTNLRAAATYTYSRPNFDDILPYRRDDDSDIEIGNPWLKYPLSLNIDLLAEKYLRQKGIISGGVFYKKIDNIVFRYVRNAHEGKNFNIYGLKEIAMAVNGQEAHVFGAEILTQFKLGFLNNFLKNFGLFGNYTFTESNAYISKRVPQNENDIIFIFNESNSDFFTTSKDNEVIPLPGQAKHTFNLALFYETEKFYVKVSTNYHSAFLDELGNDKGLDVYYDESLHIDLTANIQLNKYLKCFVDVMNITNEPLRYYMGSRNYFKQQEYYSWWGRVGVKFDF